MVGRSQLLLAKVYKNIQKRSNRFVINVVFYEPFIANTDCTR